MVLKIEKYFRSIFPIIKKTSDKRYVMEGTACYIEYKNNLYLITAAHVQKNAGDQSELFLSLLDAGAIFLNGYGFITQGDYGDCDILIYPLKINSHFSEILSRYIPISLNFNSIPDCERSHLMVIGFPHNSISYIKEGEDFSPNPLIAILEESDGIFYSKYSRSVDRFIIAKYPKYINKVKYDTNGEEVVNIVKKQSSSSLRGTSGGGIFRIFVDSEDRMIGSVIEGIIIELKEGRHLVATRKEILKNIIDEKLSTIEFSKYH